MGLRELARAATSRMPDATERFEEAFAAHFGFPHGLYFSYGRAALFALLRGMGWTDARVLVPAYTCTVVPHAIKLSGNRVAYVDCAPDHFNVPADALEDRITPDTRMVIATPLFGYPLDRRGYERATAAAPETFLLHDVAHAYACEDRKGVQLEGADGALFGLGIGKSMTTLYGGMLLLRSREIYEAVRSFRAEHFHTARTRDTLSRLSYALSSWAAFREPFLSPVSWLERNTGVLDRFTRYYYGQDGVELPGDYRRLPTLLQAKLGLEQLPRFERRAARRWANSQRYENRLAEAGFPRFAVQGIASYSHFPLAVADREAVIADLARRGVQLGRLVDYSCPELPGYEQERAEQGPFPNASWFGRHMINLPNWPDLALGRVEEVVAALVASRAEHPEWYLEQLPSGQLEPPAGAAPPRSGPKSLPTV
jgi:perosamine synthetase